MTADGDPLVGVIMGSASDLPIMKFASDALATFEVPHECRILSAHRTPDRMVDYARTAAGRGLKVIIAGAGGSAHLPGMSAVETRLPVIGVAVVNGADTLNAAVGSMLYLPKGAPLATMGRNEAGAWNAGLLAIRILGLSDDDLAERYERHVREMAEQVVRLDDHLGEVGPQQFLDELAEPHRGAPSGSSTAPHPR